MGLIKAAFGAAGGVLADQWKEFFYCEAIPADVLAVKGKKKTTGRSSNTKGDENIITNGSVIAVANGQCMLIVEQGKIVDLCAEPGEYTYDTSTEPSLFSGDLGSSIKDVFQNIGKRFTFGGEAPKDQRVYYFNTKELIGNKYGTPSPVPFRVVDQRAGIDLDIGIRCFGEYSIRLTNPMLFYKNVCGNVTEDFRTEEIAGQMKTELLTALQPAFAKISDMGIRYSALPGHTLELAEALNEQLSSRWRDLRGMEIVSFGADDQGAAAQRRLYGPHPGGGTSGGSPGQCHAGGGQQPGRRPGDGLHGHGDGRTDGGHERPEPLSDGRPAAPAACPGSRSFSRSRGPRSRRLDLFLRAGRHYRQVLPRVRQAKACRRRLDLLLRRGEQGQVLLRMRSQKARRCTPVQVRQVRLGAGGSRPSAQVLPGVRRPL